MAELFSSYVVTEILKKLQSVVTDTITRAWGLEGDLQKLSNSAGRLKTLLQKVRYVEAVENQESIKDWLQELQKVVYEVADVLDEFYYEILRRKIEVRNQLKRKLREFVSCNNPIVFRVHMTVKVKDIRASLADMEKEAPLVLQTITIPENTAIWESGIVPPSLIDRMTYSFLSESERPFGRADEVEKIVKLLQASSDGDAPLLSVISIVGFGGLGKTTLAKLVFEEAEKKNYFNEKMWICVSEPFDIQKILAEMLQKLDKTTGGLTNIDAIVNNLKQHLENKSFLLVLDDVWNKESKMWNYLKTCLEKICGKSGNFVIATTRGSDVAEIMESSYVEVLKPLSDRECWSIIKEKAVGNERKSNISHDDMEIIGMKIANKCGGVPLAAKVISGVLSSLDDKDEWLSILHNNVWNEVDKDQSISGVLKLSFDHLPHFQKLCFAYCSIFPKDVVFEKTKLIQLWMAEEFLNTTLENGKTSAKLLEDVGEEYFHSLLVNSFFQDAQKDNLGNIVGCKMHDLLHDLASSISKSRSLQCGSNCFETSSGHRLSFSCDQVSKVEEILGESRDKKTNLRCLFCRVDVSPMLCNFRRLRSLDMSEAKLKDLPDAIRKLVHLRYLDISKNESIEELPESITKLYNLQTLRVFQCKSLKELPRKIRNLASLRHLGIDDKRLMPLEVGRLTNLQTLPFFVVGEIGELEGLNELRGEMVVCGLEKVRDKTEAKRAKMKEKKLSKLVLQWMEVEEEQHHSSGGDEEAMKVEEKGGNHEEVMEGLEAPKHIQSLTVEWYMGKEFPEWVSESYKLVELTLNNCRRCEEMPTLGHLPNLKLVKLEKMDNIKSIGTEFYGKTNNMDTLVFPSLEEFSIMNMKRLVKWVSPNETSSKIFLKLRKLNIEYCPHLTTCPLSQSIHSSASSMQLDGFGCYSMQIWCNLKSLEQVSVKECRKLTFGDIGLTNLDSLSMKEDDSVKNQLSGCSKLMILKWWSDFDEGLAFPTLLVLPLFLKVCHFRKFVKIKDR